MIFIDSFYWSTKKKIHLYILFNIKKQKKKQEKQKKTSFLY